MGNGASSAASPRRLGMVAAVFSAASTVIGAVSGRALRTGPTVTPEAARKTAQDEAIREIHALNGRKARLMIDREILVADRKEAVRLHKPVCSIDQRLQAITNELLRIG